MDSSITIFQAILNTWESPFWHSRYCVGSRSCIWNRRLSRACLFRYDKSLLTVARLTFNIVDISLSVLPCADNSAQHSLLQEMCWCFGCCSCCSCFTSVLNYYISPCFLEKVFHFHAWYVVNISPFFNKFALVQHSIQVTCLIKNISKHAAIARISGHQTGWAGEDG